jgi:hypothetical protein
MQSLKHLGASAPITSTPWTATSWEKELAQAPKVIASSITVSHDFEFTGVDESTTTLTAKLKIAFDESGIDLEYQEKEREEDSKGWGYISHFTIPSKVLAIKLAELILDYYES